MTNQKNNLAVIDIGTNSFHLIVASLAKSEEFEIIEDVREVLRLSEAIQGDLRRINPSIFSTAVETLKKFKSISDSHGAKLRAVATSAVREAVNQNEFVSKVFYESGVEIEVIDGKEEARLVYLGISKAVPVNNKRTLMIDIGGGSTELLIGENGRILFAESLKLGAVRLSQKFFQDFVLNDEGIADCRNYVWEQLSPVAKEINKICFDMCVGSAGTTMAAGFMIDRIIRNQQTKKNILNNYEFSAEEFFEIRSIVLNAKTVDERKKIPTMEQKRADVIPGGVIILDEIIKALGIETITISSYSLREGIIIDTLRKSSSLL